MPRRIILAAIAAIAAIALAGCGGSSTPGGPTSTDGGGAYPVTIEGDGRSVEIPARPTTIVSLSPTATEMLFAIGAADQVEAVDDQSNHPPEAPITDLSGFEPNLEAIASYEPDLVVVSNTTPELDDGLAALDIPLLLQSAAVTLEDTYRQIEDLGVATGHEDEAAEVVADIESEVEEITRSVPVFEVPPTYYYELDPTYFTLTSTTFVGELFGRLGLRNIADPADDGSGYPQLSAEFIVDADPDLIFLADSKCCDQDAETVADRPGWDQIEAVRNGGVVPLDDDIASRWGPRVVDLLRAAADAVTRLGVPS